MYHIVDLEATCWENPKTPDLNEIIDIGIVVCDTDYNILKTWSSFVKPRINIKLSPFCKRLTSIRQSDVDSASCLSDVIIKYREWFSSNFYISDPIIWYTWGSWDLKCFVSDCERNNIEFPFSEHKNLKDIYSNKRKCSKADKLSLKEVIIRENIYFPYKFHRGINDALAAAKIAKIISLIPEQDSQEQKHDV